MKQKNIEIIIQETADVTARKTVRYQRIRVNMDLYRVMERLLRSYKDVRALVEDTEDYGFYKGCQIDSGIIFNFLFRRRNMLE